MTHYSILIAFHTVLLFVCALATEKAKINSNNIILDISQAVRDIGQQGNKADEALNVLKRIMIENVKRVDQFIMYFQTDMTNTLYLDVQDGINVVGKLKGDLPTFNPKILFSIREAIGRTDNLTTAQYIHQNYAKTIGLIADHSSVVAGLSIEASPLENNCHHNGMHFKSQHPLTSIISEMRDFVTISGYFKMDEAENTFKLGYEVHINYMNCSEHLMNMESADFLIIKIPLKRNDKIFVESYGLFIKNLEDELTTHRVNKELDNKTVCYIKLRLETTLERGELHAFVNQNQYYGSRKEEIYNEKEEEWLNFTQVGLASLDARIARRYENLLAEYMREWTRNSANQQKVILSCLHGYPYFGDAESFESLQNKWKRIPYIPNFPTQQLGNGFSFLEQFPIGLQQSTDMFLKDVAAAGFNTMMVTSKTWDEFTSRNDTLPFCSSSDLCRPHNVFYLIENDEQLKKIRYAPSIIAGSDDIDVNLVTFSNDLNIIQLKEHWGAVINDLQKKNVTPSCQIWAGVFQNVIYNLPCKTPNACNAIRFRRTFGDRCNIMHNITSTVIWIQELDLDKVQSQNYQFKNFIDDIMKRLDSFVIGREIISKEFPNKTIILQIKSHGYLLSEVATSLYCNALAERISQFYEALLTWALIHEFPVILEPAKKRRIRYDNPLAWKQLEVMSQNGLFEPMRAGPVFIRRSHSTSKVFGSWTNGMYPCISRATIKTTATTNFDNGYSGVTLNMRLRKQSRPLGAEELKTLLLFSLGKFSALEISLKPDDFSVLRGSLSNLKENLKMNNIYGKRIYLQLPKGCTQNDFKTLNETVSGFINAGLQVNLHDPNACFNNTIPGTEIGYEFENCEKLVLTRIFATLKTNPKFAQVKYIICSTVVEPVTSKDEKQMQDYLDSHLYLKKVIHYLFPNLKRIIFRLRPTFTGRVTEEQIANLHVFLSDINNFAKAYKIHYFLLPAFSTESNSHMEASFWKITNYVDLTNLSVYQEYDSDVFNDTIWVPTFSTNANSYLPRVASQPLFPIVGTTLLIISIFILAILFWRRRSQRLTPLEIQQFYSGHQVILRKAVDERRNNKYTVNIFDGLVFQKDYEMSKEEITLHEKITLGHGKFSTVHPATLQNVLKIAAVKVANKKCSSSTFKGMLSEVKLLCYVGDHVNLVKFIGCYTKEIQKGMLWIVTEHCGGGSLHSFLRITLNTRDTNSIDLKVLIKFSLEIASGMEYITNQKIIHGNLCTHSVLLDAEGKHCKIYGCGGLWRKMGEHRKCMRKNNEPSKWQWMAPETLKHMTYSMESDVWNFGVTIWEIFTFGDIPFSKVSWSSKFIDDLEHGMRLQMPQGTSNELFNVMQDCWSAEPKNRPDFSELVKQLNILLEQEDHN